MSSFTVKRIHCGDFSMEESYGCVSAADLLCDEEAESLSSTICEPFESEPFIEVPLLSDEWFGWMVEREAEYLPRDDYVARLRSGELDIGSRRDALDWMVKACVCHCFGEVCLYSAMNYLDRFLSAYDLLAGKTWAVQLVSVACLLLAAKIDEVNVPNPIDLQCGVIQQPGEAKFCLFEARTVQRMEMLLLNSLKWNIKPYNPLNFVEYFLRKINRNRLPEQPWIARSIQILVSMIKGIDFLEFRPSEIAAAVATIVSGELEGVVNSFVDKELPCFTRVEKGRVAKCLRLVQDLMIHRSCSANAGGSGSLSSVTDSPDGVLEAAVWSYRSEGATVGMGMGSSPSSLRSSPEAKRGRMDH